jgi:hypothetical protein
MEESGGDGDLVDGEAQEVGGLGAHHLPLHGFWEAWMLLPQNIKHPASKIRRSFLQLERVCAAGDGLMVVAVDRVQTRSGDAQIHTGPPLDIHLA